LALGAMAAALLFSDVSFGQLLGIGDVLAAGGTGIKNMAKGLKDISTTMDTMNETAGDGFVAIRSEGGSTSMIMGGNDVMKNLVDGKITVDVNIPKMEMPAPVVHVYLDSNKMKDLVKSVISEAG